MWQAIFWNNDGIISYWPCLGKVDGISAVDFIEIKERINSKICTRLYSIKQ